MSAHPYRTLASVAAPRRLPWWRRGASAIARAYAGTGIVATVLTTLLAWTVVVNVVRDVVHAGAITWVATMAVRTCWHFVARPWLLRREYEREARALAAYDPPRVMVDELGPLGWERVPAPATIADGRSRPEPTPVPGNGKAAPS